MKRAANQTGADLSALPEAVNGSHAGPTQAAADIEASKLAAFSNGIASSVAAQPRPATPAQAVQQLQIVRLLQDLGERLRQSEKEREILWKELDGCRKLLTDIEDKTSKTEKSYGELEARLDQAAAQNKDAARQTEIDKLQEKISAIETTAGSAILRVEDALNESSKLSRRLEEVNQDKVRLLRKIDSMEETLAQTQETLKAKALVLLTDHALAARTQLPQSNAWSGNDTLRVASAQTESATAQRLETMMGQKSASMNMQPPQRGISTALVVSLVAAGLVGGWALSHFRVPSQPSANVAQISSSTNPPEASIQSLESQEEIMARIATLANAVEPGSTTPEPVAEAAEPSAVAPAAAPAPTPLLNGRETVEASAVSAFRAEPWSANPSGRIEPDVNLPAAVREIETRAFSGDGEAQHDLAAIYVSGHAGVKTDYERAAQWFDEAAHNNVANAQYNLGVLYHQGLGVKQDTAKAIQLYRVASANHHPEAQYNLGIAHIEGVGADYSPGLAASYFEEAAASGIVEAAYNLGLIEENGLRGAASSDDAVFWFKTAADQGSAQAKEALEQLKQERGMGDQDVARIHNRIAVLKPNAFTPRLPAPQPQTPAPKKQVAATPVKKAAVYDSMIVSQIQEQLSRAGLYNGAADGNVNTQTQEAVRTYQGTNGLKVDGRPTEDVLVHMLANELKFTAPGAGNN